MDLKNIIKEELLKEAGYKKLENVYRKIKNKVDNYNYKKGESVVIKHQTWQEPRIMTVAVAGTKPKLKKGAIEIDLKYQTGYEFILPVKLIDEYKKEVEKRKETEKANKPKLMSDKQFEKLMQGAVEDSTADGMDVGHSETYDMAENFYNDQNIKRYVAKKLKDWGDPITKQNIIDYIVNQLEMNL